LAMGNEPKNDTDPLLGGFTREIVRPECNPGFESVHCIAHLNEDIGEVLPYLNAVLGGTTYLTDPPEIMFHHQGRIIKVGAREIAINALTDEAEADRVLNWLQREINQAWKNRGTITPSTDSRSKPKVIDILKQLPKTNCGACGLPTCMVFAAQMADGGRDASQCPELSESTREDLDRYLEAFHFD